MGEVGPSRADAGPADFESPYLDDAVYEQENTNRPGPSSDRYDAGAAGQRKQCESIQPGPLVRDIDNEDPCENCGAFIAIGFPEFFDCSLLASRKS